jgi:aryl-alcohol dehydrogenase-like predicted oxidoreductase
MTFGDQWGWGSAKPEAQKIYQTYRDAGGNFSDTANFYTGGTSEKFGVSSSRAIATRSF